MENNLSADCQSQKLNKDRYLKIPMATKQVNVKMSKNLFKSAESFAESYGYRNVQELMAESLREKIFEKSDFDESFSEKEIKLIDAIIEKSIKKKKLVDAKEYFKEFR